jgi:hypothetical protein
MADPEQAARASLRRSMLMYAAVLVAAVLVIVLIIGSGAGGGAYVTVSIVGAVGLLLAHQVWQHVLDMGSPLAESEGEVLRKWKRSELIIAWDSYYLNVDRAIFRVRPEDYIQVDVGMYVKVVHFPRTLQVVSVHEVLRARG